MPFENLKRQLDLRKQAQDAKDKHEQWLQEQQKSRKLLIESQQNEVERQKEEKLNLLLKQSRQCFDSSKIDTLTDELITKIPGVHKSVLHYNPEDWMSGESIDVPRAKFKYGLIHGLLYDQDRRMFHDTIKAYECIKLTWNQRDPNNYSYMMIGFLPDKSLIVGGDPYEGLTILPEHEWHVNERKIEKAIEKAFINPNHVSSFRAYPDAPPGAGETFSDGR